MMIVNEASHLFGAGFGLRMIGRALGGCGCDGRFIVKAVKIAASFLEVFDPFLGLGWISAVSESLELEAQLQGEKEKRERT